MSSDNPLLPQGSLLGQRQESRSRVRTAFFCVLAVHVLAIVAALIVQGCKREQPPPAFPELSPLLPTFDTNLPPVVETNLLPPVGVADTALPPGMVTAPPGPGPLPGPLAVTPPAVERPVLEGAPSEYTVAQGDTFYTIAKKLGVPMRALMDANPGVDPRRLRVGQKLLVPTAPAMVAAPAAGGTAPPAAATSGGEQIYVVKSGDNLTKIAKQFGVTVQALRQANNLRTDRIKVGDQLRIPAPAQNRSAPAPASQPGPGTQPAPWPPSPSSPGASRP